ncbi:MAG: transglutaminase domain-containing protein [Saprospiraceae bacterium]
MRAIFTAFLFIFFSFSISAQSTATDPTAPFDSTYVFNIIAEADEPVRAIFEWIAKNVTYDVASLADLPDYSHPSELLDSVWEKREGVCMHYAELMNAFCKKAGYESMVVNGYTIHEQRADDRYGHSWNAVKVNGKWRLYDVTWAAGYRNGQRFIKKYDPKWYNVQPAEFVYSHVPFDPLWQLVEQPLTAKEIQVKQSAKTMDKMPYAQIIQQERTLDAIEKDQRQLARIQTYSDNNPLVAKELARIQSNIEIQIFKRGVDNYNTSIDIFNDFIAQYNRGLGETNWSDEEFQQVIQNVNDELASAEQNFTQLKPDNPIYEESLANNLQLLSNYKQRVKTLNGFAQRYLKTWRIFRWLVRLDG